MKAWYKSKTILFGVLTALAAFLADVQGMLEGQEGVPAWVLMAIGGVVVILRFVTKDAVGLGDDTSS